jgi:hypothetical protein
MGSVVLITFGDGHERYRIATKRIVAQAEEIGLFNRIENFTDEDLQAHTDFWERHAAFIKKNRRGHGYWIWKPYLIMKTMETMVDGDLLLYLDSGCEIDIRRRDQLIRCFEIARRDFVMCVPTQWEHLWSKMDLIVHLNCNHSDYLNKPQAQTGRILMRVCDKTRQFVRKWYETGCNYHLIDDSPSVIQNLDSFKEHRHDQSIFSLLGKRMNLFSKQTLKEALYITKSLGETSKIDLSHE